MCGEGSVCVCIIKIGLREKEILSRSKDEAKERHHLHFDFSHRLRGVG